jgi:hypothetical protein
MSVQLEAIKLNHNPGSATADAINIRRNATQTVTVPEWRRGISVKAEDAPACYAKKETAGNTITIQAQFTRLHPSIKSAEIRAVDADVEPPGEPKGCIGFLLWLIKLLIRAVAGNVLGEVKARTVTFGHSTTTGFETFELEHVRLSSAGIGVRTTTWRWQYRRKTSDPWTDFATSRHRIYVVLETPTAPWSQTPYSSGNVSLPWTDVLDYACAWAALKTGRDAAATAMTQELFDLGPSVITYDCPGGGSSAYAWGVFDCTAFVERLSGGTGNGIYVNCTDCATILSTFANIVGCDLWQGEMGYWFELNRIQGIGSPVFEPVCDSCGCGWQGAFSYHEVAWKGAVNDDDRIFDACLLVDGDADPTAAPHTPMLVANMRFGAPGDGDYRDRLATPVGRPSCDPQPSTRQRRAIM